MIDINKKYTYKNGETARILCTDRPFAGNLVVLSMRPNGAIVQSTTDGKSQCYDGEYDLVEAWEPKKGELCFFWDNAQHGCHVRKFIKLTHEGYVDSCNTYWIHCAPFTGTLPEAFKGLV